MIAVSNFYGIRILRFFLHSSRIGLYKPLLRCILPITLDDWGQEEHSANLIPRPTSCKGKSRITEAGKSLLASVRASIIGGRGRSS